MITLPSNFIEANSQDKKQPDILALIEDKTLSAEKTTQTDWSNNTAENQVDYASAIVDSGDVIIDIIGTAYGVGGDAWRPSEGYANAQGFQIQTENGYLDFVDLYLMTDSGAGVYKVNIMNDSSGSPGSVIATVVTENIDDAFTGWVRFDFSSQNILLLHSTQYYAIAESTASSGTNDVHWRADMTSAGYAYGSFWEDTGSWFEYPNADAFFRAVTRNYLSTGSLTTDNIDIGEVPTETGEWAIIDVTPDDTSLTYTAEYSTTGAWGGEEVSIGGIIDGQVMTDLKRYWRVTATFAASTTREDTPILQSIKADYTTYRKFNQIKDLGYEALVMEMSSLTSKVDFFEAASIGKISVKISMTSGVSAWIYADTLFNKIVRVKLGYVHPGLTELDYIDYFTGAVDDWDVGDGVLNLQLKDLSKDWKLPVPSKWEDTGDDVIYTSQHPIDVILDIFQNKIIVRDSGVLFDSFGIVKAATSGYKVTRTITGKVEDAKKLVEQLRVLLFAFYLPRGDGKIGIKQFDKTEATVTSFNDDNTINIEWEANSESLINRTKLYYDWLGTGDNEEDFDELDEGDDTTSQTDFRSIVPFELKDKWTRAAEASQISGLETKIFDQFSEMPSMVRIECDIKDIAYEAGDQVLVTTANAPGSGGAGIVDVRFLLISKNLNFLGSKIVFEALRVMV